jgi:ATP-dependent RNA helicase SUPV3L1/SUV3
MQIINSNSVKDKEIKMIPEMLNLLGCSKDNFKKLLKSMNYKIINRENEIFFKYTPKKSFKKQSKEVLKETPFRVLKDLNFN